MAFVYVIQATGTNRIKLGYSIQPEQRLKELQTGSPYKLKMLAQWPGTRYMESQLHRALAAYRQDGEWFEVPPFAGMLIWQIVKQCDRVPSLLKRPPQLGRPYVESVKGSKGTWAFRFRWRQGKKRRVEYSSYVTDEVYELIQQGDYAAFKGQMRACREAQIATG